MAGRSSRTRSAAWLLGLVVLRLRRRRGEAALVCLGVAVATAMLAGTFAVSQLAADSAMSRTLGRLPASDRVVRASAFRSGRTIDYQRSLDPLGAKSVALHATRLPTQRAVLVHGVRARDGSVVQVVAIDDVARALTVRLGRRPRRCDGRRCEAVFLGGDPPRGRHVDVNGLRLTLVGSGRLSAVPLGLLAREVVQSPGRGSQEGRYTRETGGTLVLLAGARPVANAPALATIGRTYYWTRPLDAAGVRPWSASGVVRQIRDARATLGAREDGSQLQAPDDAIAAERRRARSAERRLTLLASQAAVALLAFAAYAASRRRRDVGDELERLEAAGARRSQLLTMQVLEAVLIAGAGAIVGFGVALVGARLGAAAQDTPARALLRASLLDGRGALLVVAIALVASGVIAVFQRPVANAGSRVGARTLDAAALAALAALVWQVSASGGLDAADLAGSAGDAPILVLLPGLAAFAAAVVAVRLLPLVFRGLERAARRGPTAVRLALLSAARSPSESAIAVAFLAISIATGVFALGYRASLQRGQRDQAAYRTGGDLAVTETPRTLTAQPDVLPLSRYRSLPDVAVLPIIRDDAQTLGTGGGFQSTLELLGVPADGLPSLPGWRTDFSSVSADRLARRLAGSASLALAGPALPAGTRSLALDARVAGSSASLEVAVQRRDGIFERLDLGDRLVSGAHRLVLAIPRRLQGARVLEVSIGAPPAEGVQLLEGSTTLTPLRARTATGTRAVTAFGGPWQPDTGVQVKRGRAGRTQLVYAADAALRNADLRYVQPGAGEPVPAIASPDVAREAGPGGILELQRVGPGITLRIVGTAHHFPGTTGGRFAVADTGRLFRALNAKSPGTIVPSSIWVVLHHGAKTDRVERALRAPTFRHPHVTSRIRQQRALADEPLARAVVWSLLIAALLGTTLGGVGIALALGIRLRDDTGELRELEALGLTPAELRWQVRLTGLLVAAIALAFGLGGGLLLSRLVTNLIAVSANGTAPVPPLIPVDPWTTIAALLAAVALAVALVVAAQTRAAFRAPTAGRLRG